MNSGPDRIDLRSDTAARPSEEMILAMAQAETSFYLAEEDEETAALEQEAAVRLGKGGSVFMPTATMANLVALLVHCDRGDGIVVPSDAHLLVAEASGLAAVAGVLPSVANGTNAEAVHDLFDRLIVGARPAPSLAWIENTHNRSGGSISDVEMVRRCATTVHDAGGRVHVDGARLPNAAAALKVGWEEIASPVDSVTLSLNKGLGAPVGAVLAGTAAFVDSARQQRERLGGAWRKPGHLAAAARVAIRTSVRTFEQDHSAARRIGEAVAAIEICSLQPVETNIVNCLFSDDDLALGFVDFLESQNVRAGRRGHVVRLVTHSGVRSQDVSRVVQVIHDYDSHLAGSTSREERLRDLPSAPVASKYVS